MQKSKTEKIKKDNVLFDYIKGCVVSLIISLALIILFAFCYKWFSLSDGAISPVTFVVKAISVLIGAIIAVKGENRGLLKGMGFGAVYMLLSFFVFSVLAGSFSFGLSGILDLVCSVIIGGIIGIIKVNKK